MATLTSEFGQPKSALCQAEYDRAVAAAIEPFTAGARGGQETSQRGKSPAESAPHKLCNTPAPRNAIQTPTPLTPVVSRPETGDKVIVPKSMWPDEQCPELGGMGWQATVVKTSATTTTIEFCHATNRAGKRYKDVQVLTSVLLKKQDLPGLDLQGP